MIDLPPGFDVAALMTDLFTLAAPFAGTGFMIAGAFLLMNIFRRI